MKNIITFKIGRKLFAPKTSAFYFDVRTFLDINKMFVLLHIMVQIGFKEIVRISNNQLQGGIIDFKINRKGFNDMRGLSIICRFYDYKILEFTYNPANEDMKRVREGVSKLSRTIKGLFRTGCDMEYHKFLTILSEMDFVLLVLVRCRFESLKRWHKFLALAMIKPTFEIAKFFNLNFINLVWLRSFNFRRLMSSILVRYLKEKCQSRFSIFSLFKNVRIMIRNWIRDSNSAWSDTKLYGFKICCVGRFTRAERALYKWVSVGAVPSTSTTVSVDFCYDEWIGKFGLCAVKIWFIYYDE
jgi:hypothetical protein